MSIKIGELQFAQFNNNSEIGESVKSKIMSMEKPDQLQCYVATIDKDDMGGQELCSKYSIDTNLGVNCLIVKGKLNGNYFYSALLVPVGYRYDINGVLKERLGCRMSVAPLEEVLTLTKMEYGSITPVGLPDDWQIFVDTKILDKERIICGGGVQTAKISIPTSFLKTYCNAEPLQSLAKL